MKEHKLKLSILVAGICAQAAAFGVIELNPILDSDVYHGTDAPTGSTETLGVSWDVESPEGSAFYHGQQSLVQFDVSGVTDPITSATLYLYVSPFTSPYASFGVGNVSVFEQTSAWDLSPGSLTWDDFSAGTDLGDISVTQESVWVTLDVTTIVQGWANNTVDNYGFLLTPEGTLSTQFASMETGSTAPILAINGAATVPEPASYAAMFGAMALCFVATRRRSQRA